MADIKYRYALSDTGELIEIEDAIRKTEYKCLVCHKSLIAKKGEINAHHFAHKYDKEGASCPSTKYLCKLALATVNWLYRSSMLQFSYGRIIRCSKDCPAGLMNKCTAPGNCSANVSNYYSQPIPRYDDVMGDFLEFKRNNGVDGSLYIYFSRKPDNIDLGLYDRAIYIHPKRQEFIDALFKTGVISEEKLNNTVGIVEFLGFREIQDGECPNLYKERLSYFGIDECGRIKRDVFWDCNNKIPKDVVFCIISNCDVSKWVKYNGKVPVGKNDVIIDTSNIPSYIRYRVYNRKIV